MEKENDKYVLPLSIVIAGMMIAAGIVLDVDEPRRVIERQGVEGTELSATWGDLGKRMVENGTIDEAKFKAVYRQRGWDEESERLLNGSDNGKLRIMAKNAGVLLNFLWALGLSSRNEILEKGEMSDPRYGGAERFASTAGWTIAKGPAMSHYSHHSYFNLTQEEQDRVDRVSRGIYRPCCSNSAHFPDCNHGMAMLGLLELMASQGANEAEMKQAAHIANSYWFPDVKNSGGCDVGGRAPAALPQRQQSGCGV